jgi:anti-sigma factor RsiW
MTKPATLQEEDWGDLIAYLDGELDANTARSLETKISIDPKLNAELKLLKQTYALLDYLPRPEPSQAFTQQTLSKVSGLQVTASYGATAHQWHPWVMGVSWFAALFLMGMIGYAGSGLMVSHKPVAASVAKAEDPAKLDAQLVQDLRVIENKRLYDLAGDVGFLRGLDDPDLFGDEK